MPNVLIEPDAPLDTKISDIPSSSKIADFSSKLLLFDNIIVPAQRLYQGTFLGVDGTRHLFIEEQGRFLEERGIGWIVRMPGGATLREACISGKEEFEEGRFNPIRRSDQRKLEMVAGSDVFISQRLADSSDLPNQTVLTIEFIEGIPIPPRQWSWDGILDFKQKNFSAYRNFWETLYAMALDLEFLNHPDPQTQLRADLMNALDEFGAKSSETFGTRIRDALSISFSPGSGVLPAIETSFRVLAGAIGTVCFHISQKPVYGPMTQNAKGMAYLSKIRTGN